MFWPRIVPAPKCPAPNCPAPNRRRRNVPDPIFTVEGACFCLRWNGLLIVGKIDAKTEYAFHLSKGVSPRTSKCRDEAIYRCNLTKKCLLFTNYPDYLIKHQKLFSLSCFKRVSDVYLIRYICKHCNTTHIFEV